MDLSLTFPWEEQTTVFLRKANNLRSLVHQSGFHTEEAGCSESEVQCAQRLRF